MTPGRRDQRKQAPQWPWFSDRRYTSRPPHKQGGPPGNPAASLNPGDRVGSCGESSEKGQVSHRRSSQILYQVPFESFTELHAAHTWVRILQAGYTLNTESLGSRHTGLLASVRGSIVRIPGTQADTQEPLLQDTGLMSYLLFP